MMIAIDRNQLTAACDVLGIKRAAHIVDAPVKPAVKTAAAGRAATVLRNLLGVGLIGGGAAGLYHLEKAKNKPAPAARPVQAAGGAAYSPQERRQFARHGMDPENLRFIQSLSRMRQGMNLESKLLQQALSGKLPADVMGGGGDEESDLESYA